MSEEGYSMDSADKEAVLALKDKVPTNIGELRQLLGFLGFFRKYVADFSRRAKPLYDLLKVEEAPAEKGKKKCRKKGVGWLVGCFGFNGPLRQYFSLYQAVSQREGRKRRERIHESKMSKQPPTRT